jgi:hypothetical protein
VVEYLRVFYHVGFFRLHRRSWRMSDGHFAQKRRGSHLVVKEKTMRNAKVLLGAALFMAMMAGAVLTFSEPTTAAQEKKGAASSSHWRHHDGHWNYWHDGDKRWYYTDGSNWYYNDGAAWNIYGFDKGFGKDGFERGEYKVPEKGGKIETPRHGYFGTPTKSK